VIKKKFTSFPRRFHVWTDTKRVGQLEVANYDLKLGRSNQRKPFNQKLHDKKIPSKMEGIHIIHSYWISYFSFLCNKNLYVNSPLLLIK
jgi:hypothetical protein